MSEASDFPPQRWRRMRRLLGGDNRTVIVALDHLTQPGRGVRLRAPARVLQEVDAAGVDAVLLRAGPASRLQVQLGRMGLVLSVGADAALNDWCIEHALRLGADAVKVEIFPGGAGPISPKCLLGPLAAACERWSMPLVVESIPVAFDAHDAHTPERLAEAARLGADLGADLIKTKFTGDVVSFAEVVALAGVPVVVLGGGTGNLRDLLTMVRGAMDAGAAGCAVGRRVFDSDRPGHVAGALVRLVHEDLGVDAALREATRVVFGASRPAEPSGDG